jgi:murein DD-endopeptidase MepM/ murein hydrolase activator NlpD
MSKVLVKEGDLVEAGQTIGLSGATGRVTGAHLHLAAFVQGAVVDPETLLKITDGNSFE